MEMELNDVLTLLLSAAATIISIKAMFQTKKVNTINLNSELLKDIYIKYLTQKIPEALRYVNYDGKGNIEGVSQIQEVLLSFLKSIKYLKYLDAEFYNDIKSKIQRLEDYIIGGELQDYQPTREDFEKHRDEMLYDIYIAMADKYENG